LLLYCLCHLQVCEIVLSDREERLGQREHCTEDDIIIKQVLDSAF